MLTVWYLNALQEIKIQKRDSIRAVKTFIAKDGGWPDSTVSKYIFSVTLHELASKRKHTVMRKTTTYLYPRKVYLFLGGYTVFTLSVQTSERQSVRPCVRNVLFLEKSLIEFHHILRAHSYVQGQCNK